MVKGTFSSSRALTAINVKDIISSNLHQCTKHNLLYVKKIDQGNNEAGLFCNILGENASSIFWIMDSAILSLNFKDANSPVF